MLIFFSVFEIELDDAADVVIGFVDRKFDAFAFFVAILENFGFLFFIQDDFDVDCAAEAAEEAADFVLNQGIVTMSG
jgi:hypothetical protein